MMPSNIEAALFGLAPTTRRVYGARIRAWMAWSKGGPLDREQVQEYLRFLELHGCSSQVHNQSLAALKRLAVEAAVVGRIDPQVAAQVQAMKARPITEIRTVRLLSAEQSSALLMAPDRKNLIGRRDAAVIALLLGCRLQRAEACGLTVEQMVRTTQDRMLIVDLVGRGGQMRSVAVPQWAALDIQRWIGELVPLEPNYLLRSVTPAGKISDSLSPTAIRDIVRRYGAVIGVPDLNPDDLRRPRSRVAFSGGATNKVIQEPPGEAANAGDYIDLKPAPPGALYDLSHSLSVRGKRPATPPVEPPPAASNAGPVPEPLQPSAPVPRLSPSPLAPRRSPSRQGAKPARYPDLDYHVLGAQLGISPTYVGRILNGHNRPSLPLAERLGALMGWSIDQVNKLYNQDKTESTEEDRNT